MMWVAPEDPPNTVEGVAGPSQAIQEQPINVKETCGDNKSQLETFKDIMLKNKNDLKKKEQELQEYASKLSEIKSRAKLSRRSKDGSSSSIKGTPKSRAESSLLKGDAVDEISQARTPKAKSSLLQRKLAENRMVFERRSKEMTANKRAVEEKVEAIRQQMDQTDMTTVEVQRDLLPVTPIRPVLVTQIMTQPPLQLGHLQDKDEKISELNNRILELEATVIDLQDNLKEKDSVIEAKTKAVTLMSADLSKKGKTTLDTLEDTKDEMRTMQANFILLETSLKGKNENLLEQLQERIYKVAELEATINRYEQELKAKQLVDSASASLSRSTTDTSADTKDAMRSMQENFVLIETSLKDKVEDLLQQLQNREITLKEAEEKIYKLESGAGVVTAPEIPDLRYRIDRLEESNRALQDEKYELQKSIGELQQKIVARDSTNGNGLVLEKDNRIAELENLIEELKSSNQLLEEESKAELQKQVIELATTNEELRSKIDNFEKLNSDLEIKMNELRAKIPDERDSTKEDDIVKKLTKELDDLNKSMIKLKAQHKGKLKNLQKQLESFKMVSDANAELVKFGNQVALLEEEKGNLQLSLVDFDELKASAGDWQDRVADLESRVTTQTADIQAHIEAIAILENQKLDLMQELHTVKQEISSLEAENAESENLRVAAEMKVVDLEEQLESQGKSHNETSKPEADSDREELLKRMEHLMQENSELVQKVSKLEEKPSSEAGSTESFETIHEDRNEMLRKIEALLSRNSELEEKLGKLEEGVRSNVGSTESFETINDTDKSELIKKIDLLSRENSDLVIKLNKFEEKGSSDTGSTESFEKIPEHGESLSRVEVLTQENNELVIKPTKVEEKYENLEGQQSETPPEVRSENLEIEKKLQNLVRVNNDLEISNVASKQVPRDSPAEIGTEEELKSRTDSLTTENNELIVKLVKLEKNSQLRENLQNLAEAQANDHKIRETTVSTSVTIASLESEIEGCRKLITEQTELIEEMNMKLARKEAELQEKIRKIDEWEAAGVSVEELQRELKESFGVAEEWKLKCTEMERKMEILEAGKISIGEHLAIVQQENKVLIEQARQKDQAAESLKQEFDATIAMFETRLEEERAFTAKQEDEITTLKEVVKSKDAELHDKYLILQNDMINIDTLQDELNACKTQLRLNENTIISLNEEIARLNSVVSSSKEETRLAQTEVNTLREELQSKAAKVAKNEELGRLLSDKESLTEEMKMMLNEQIKENADLRIVIEKANAEVVNSRAVLAEKESEVASLEAVKSTLEESLRDFAATRAEAESRIEFLQSNLDINNKYTDDIKSELSDAYKMLELLKEKHTEDVELLNRRLEDLIEALHGKSSECEMLRTELETKVSECRIMRKELDDKSKFYEDLERRSSEFEVLREKLAEKEKVIGQNVTEQAKVALELRVKELEQKLEEFEARTQTQLLKRKILAANLKKKSSEIAEHEARATQLEAKIAAIELRLAELEPRAAENEAKVVEFEEKWILEKGEKESANRRIREIECVVEDRDRAILQLEDKLQRTQREAASAVDRMGELSNELQNSTEKISALLEKITEMGEEVEKLRTEIELKSSEIESERAEKIRIIAEYDSCRRKIVDEEVQRQQVLEEAKEKARELGVRMQVMETEYVEQLNTIQTLRTENGMLVSKQAQISERLENAEKEAAEQKILLDQLQRETAVRETANLRQQSLASGSEDDQQQNVEGKASSAASQPCDHCDQCQTVVQALEAKLQERDAEIENLDNELANSIGNFVHMRESLRVSDLINQSSSRNRSLEDARDNSDLVFQYNALMTSNTEIRDQLNAVIQENQELKEKIASLQALNDALEERTDAVEHELIEGREATTRLHAVDALHEELAEKCRLRESELRDVRSELEAMKQQHEKWTSGMKSQFEQRESERRELATKCDVLVHTNDILEGEVVSLREKLGRSERSILELEEEVEEYKLAIAKCTDEVPKPVEKSAKTNANVFFAEKGDGPQLFDAAKVFGLPPTTDIAGQREIADLRNVMAMREIENIRLSEEVRRLGEQHVNQQSEAKVASADCQKLQNELTHLEQLLAKRNGQIDALNSELNNIGAQLTAQFGQQENVDRLESEIAKMRQDLEHQSFNFSDAKVTIENLTATNNELQRENQQYLDVLNVVSLAIKNLEELDVAETSAAAADAISLVVKEKLDEILHSLAALKDERSELLALQETGRQRILELEMEAEASNDLSRVQELELRVDGITRERDIKQLQVNDLTRSLEEMQESVESASSKEEIRLRNLQAALDEALSEHERLKVELQALKREREAEGSAEEEKPVETAEVQSAQSLRSMEDKGLDIGDVEAGWDDETAKLQIDEEIWSWNPEDAQLAAAHNLLAAAPLQPSVAITLRTRIAELEDTIKDLESEKDKLVDEAKNAQARSAKLVKKLKEFKIQNESLQQELKIQKATSDFGDLDSAIEDELKSQIASLEKTLNEAKEKHKKTIAERDNFAKRIDVLLAANERLVEMKERQDMEVELLQIRTRDLVNKQKAIDWQLQEACGDETLQAVPSSRALESSATPVGHECLCNKYKEEIDELRDELEALSSENEQLQKLLEEQKNTRLSSESKFAGELAVHEKVIEDLTRGRSELENDLEDARREYNNLRDQCDQSARSLDEQTPEIKQSREVVKFEISDKSHDFEAQITSMRREIVDASSQINILQEHLETLLREKEELIESAKKHGETKEKLSALSDSLAEVTDLLNARVQQVAELNQEIQKLKRDKNGALNTVEVIPQNHTLELFEKQHGVQQYLQQCQAQLAEKSREILELREKMSEIEAERASNATELNDKIQENLALREKLSEVDSECVTNAARAQNLREEIDRLNNALTESRLHRESLQSELAGKEQQAYSDEDQVRKYSLEIERLNEIVTRMQKSSADTIDEANRKIHEIEEREACLKKTITELSARESDVTATMYRELGEKDGKIAQLQQMVSNLEQKMYEITNGSVREKILESPEVADGLPVSRMLGDESQELKTTVEQLRAELSRRNEDIEDYKYQLSESTYPSIIQALQDQVNQLYEEKAQVEEALRAQKEAITESLRQQYQRQFESVGEVESLRRQTSESRSEESLVSALSEKDTKIRNLKVEIEEKGVRFRELYDHYESAMVEINERRIQLASKDEEIQMLRAQLEATSKEYEILQRALKKELPPSDVEALRRSETSVAASGDAATEQSSNELDLALYMLHQRDVRVEELTHELMQLLEERDTLQLKLSNAIRVNEELRRAEPTDATSSEIVHGLGDVEPLVEQPSPSKSIGPIEIAREAIYSPSEEKVALAQKLSQLHNMGHRRDVRLMDERELRHNQQMSLLAHRDVLSTLPPEAAAKLVNANYTLSRDVQSQSSVLMNWLWGKSTPKVVHM